MSSFDTEKTGIRAITPGTSVKVSIAVWVTIVIFIGSAVWGARGKLGDLEFEQRAQRSLIEDLPRRRELDALEKRVTKALRLQMRKAMLRCPRAATSRGGSGAWMDCKVLFPTEETEEE
jgi:hypothetical protein